MKKISLLFFMFVCAVSWSQTTDIRFNGDTINGKDSNFFYQWWYDEGYITEGDTNGIECWDFYRFWTF